MFAFNGVLVGRPRFGRAFLKIGVGKLKKGHRTRFESWNVTHGTGVWFAKMLACCTLYLMILRSCLRLIRTLLVKSMEINGCDLDSLDHPLMMNLWHKIWCCPCLPNKDNQTWSALARPPVKFEDSDHLKLVLGNYLHRWTETMRRILRLDLEWPHLWNWHDTGQRC